MQITRKKARGEGRERRAEKGYRGGPTPSRRGVWAKILPSMFDRETVVVVEAKIAIQQCCEYHLSDCNAVFCKQPVPSAPVRMSHGADRTRQCGGELISTSFKMALECQSCGK